MAWDSTAGAELWAIHFRPRQQRLHSTGGTGDSRSSPLPPPAGHPARPPVAHDQVHHLFLFLERVSLTATPEPRGVERACGDTPRLKPPCPSCNTLASGGGVRAAHRRVEVTSVSNDTLLRHASSASRHRSRSGCRSRVGTRYANASSQHASRQSMLKKLAALTMRHASVLSQHGMFDIQTHFFSTLLWDCG